MLDEHFALLFSSVAKLLPILVLPVAVGAAILLAWAGLRSACAIRRRSPPALGPWLPSLSLSVIMAMLGTAVGVMAGASRETVTGEVIPAFLGLATAFIGYVITRDAAKIGKQWRTAIAPATVALILTTVWGVLLGAEYRISQEHFQAGLDIGNELRKKIYTDFCYELVTQQGRELLRLGAPKLDFDAMLRAFGCTA